MKLKLLTLGLNIALASPALAQKRVAFEPSRGAIIDGKTIVKTDLIGAITSNYHIGVERILSKYLSLQLSYTYTPWRGEEIYEAFNSYQAAYLPEDGGALYRQNLINLDLRIYTSKRGYGHGFYLSPYLNYTIRENKDRLQDIEYPQYRLRELNQGLAFGMGIGAQWYFGKKKNFLVDLVIFGLHRSPRFSYKSSVRYVGESDQFKPEDSQAVGASMLKDHYDNSTGREGELKSSEGGRRLEVQSQHQRFGFRGQVSLGFRF